MNLVKSCRQSDPILSRVYSNGYNLPYISSNWVQPIFLEHIKEQPCKFWEVNSQWVVSRNYTKLPHALWMLKQDNSNVELITLALLS